MNANVITVPSTLSTAHIRVSVLQRQSRSLIACLMDKETGAMLVYIGDTPADQCLVRVDEFGNASLWIGRTAFDIPVSEAQRAAEALEIRLVDTRTKRNPE